MKKRKLFLVLLFIEAVVAGIEDKPRIQSNDGNLIFSTGDQRSITFKPGQSGSVYMDEEDLVHVISDYRRTEAEVGQIKGDLNSNTCNSSPCANEARCVNLYKDFYCECEPRFTGRTCTADVDECSNGAAVCLNGATCTNQSPGYQCQCTPEFSGTACETPYDDCVDDRAKCGNGICFDLIRNRTGVAAYDCVCNAGWQLDQDGVCQRDVNECLTSPCYIGVSCYNTPGSFYCGSCPAGYSGNGIRCDDINECLTNNGGCSQSPMVECINEPGSSRCGPCPSGYEGNGYYCEPSSPCIVNNGGCYPGANCTDAPELGPSAVTCECPDGMTGDGYGPMGCQTEPSCYDACQNGLCFNNDMCLCFVGWQGRWCDEPAGQALCDTTPCLNGGTCTADGAGYYCECAPGWAGANCQQQAQECGGTYVARAGNVRFPLNGGTHSSRCTWYIEGDRSDAILVEFDADQWNVDNCQSNTLTIYDGPNDQADSLGQFCETAPGNITSGSNYITIDFSPSGTTQSTFAFRWTPTEKVCGRDFIGVDSGVITSPNYPLDYDPSSDCYWTIQVDAGKVVSFDFGEIHIESHTTCAFDYLQVRDGILPTSPELVKLCSSQTPASISTSGPGAWVHFHSDSSVHDSGFSIQWTSANDPDSCGGVLSDGEGSISSPGFPLGYTAGVTCYWNVQATPGDIVGIQFTDIDITSTTQECIGDYVAVYGGDSEDSPLVGQFCGSLAATELPGELRSPANLMFIEFITEATALGRGFSANYFTVCGGSISESGATFHSPGFPGSYNHQTDCSWIITAPDDNVIVLTFLFFDVEGINNGGSNLCYFDYVDVRDGGDASAPLIARKCGPQTPPPIMSSGSLMYVRFVSDASINGDGWQARADFDETGSCGMVLNQPEGAFTTPGHPNNYPHGANCTWFLNADPGNVIQVDFTSFQLEGSDCRYDYVRIFDGMFIEESQALGPKYCSTNAPPRTTSTGPHMTVQFVSDTSVSSIGFYAEYTWLDFHEQCGGEITAPSGEIVTPLYPENYPLDRQCIWIINTDPNQQIEGQFNAFQIEGTPGNCLFDYVELRNGDQPESPLIGKYCGSQVPPPFATTHNHLYVKFYSDTSVTYSGFRLAYDATLDGCGGPLIGSSGSLHSPNYPFAYNHGADCQYLIRTSEGAGLKLTFTDFDLEGGSTCTWDWIQIFDGATTGDDPISPRLCGSTIPGPFYTLGNQALVEFRSDASNNGRGWVFNWESDYANRTIGWPFAGLIQSPNYPYMYPNNVVGNWNLLGPLGSTITIGFNALDLEACNGASCSCDYVAVYDGPTEEANVMFRSCGTTIPLESETSTHQSLVQFRSDVSGAGTGFELRYTINACGDYFGDCSADGGCFISSPSYPTPVATPTECYYFIDIEPGKKIRLSILDLTLSNPECDSYLNVYNGGFALDEAQLAQWCSSRTNGQVESTGSEMTLKFAADSQNSKFRVNYNGLAGGCGGHFINEDGTFTSPNFPAVYPPNSDCEWLIDTTTGNTVNLYFEEFHLEGSGTYCYFDYVRVYDGPNITYPLLGTLCGANLPEPVRSSSNHMFVHFQSDSSIQYGGFRATFNTNRCGNVITAFDDGSIQSPNYPDVYPINSLCTWEIKAPSSSDAILINFSHLDTFVDPLTGNRDTCFAADFIQIYEGQPTSNTAKYCGTRLPPPIVSAGWKLKVTMDARRSGYNSQRSGFYATYTTETEQCGGEYWGEEGYFSSPGYSTGAYAPRADCSWLLTSSPGNKVSITFTDFELENPSASGTCYDYVEIRENDSTGTLLAKVCGSDLPNDIVTFTSHIIYVRFYANTNNNIGRGFMAYYSHIYGGAIIGSESGQIASPLYPHKYPQLVDAYWTLYVRYHHTINYEFLAFGTESHVSCGMDYLRMYNGEDMSAPLIGTYCGFSLPPPGETTDATLTMHFHSDEYYNELGFLMNWNDTSKGDIPDDPNPPTVPPGLCGQDFVVVPNYPLPLTMLYSPGTYPQGMNCIWNLYTTPGSRIQFSINEMSIEGTNPYCYFDYLKMYDGPSTSYPLLRTACDRNQVLPIRTQSTSDTMTIYFRTDSSINYAGFNATYEKGCGGFPTARQGQINTPGFPANYPDDLDCQWKLRVQLGYTVEFVFNRGLGRFGIDGSGAFCNESESIDYLEMRNGYEDDAPPLSAPSSLRNGDDRDAFICESAPVTLVSSGNEVMIKFKSDAIHTLTNYPGFQVRYTAVGTGCGGDYEVNENTPSVWFTSPNYPDPYDHSEYCIYTIRGDVGAALRLDFDQFDVETSSTCYFDYVKVFDDEFDHGSPVATFCGSAIPDTTRITGHVMILIFRTDSSISSTGWNATVTEDYCGGATSGFGGNVSHHEYPDPYSSGALDCEYVVRAPNYHNVEVNFVDQFSVPGSPFSRCVGGDYVEFRDYLDVGYFYLRNPDTNLVAGINALVSSDNVEAQTHNAGYNQLWLWDFDHIVSVYDDTKVLAAATENPTASTNVHVETFTGADYQRWERLEGGFLRNKNSTNLVLTILGTTAGTSLGLRTQATSNAVNQVWDFEHTKIGRQLGVYCGTSTPTTVIKSSGEALVIRHHSEEGNQGKWKVAWRASEETCGGEYRGDSGFIASPNFPNPTDANRRCSYFIYADEDRSIKLTFESVNLGTLSCYYDYVDVYNGHYESSPLFWNGKICFNNVPTDPFISSGNTMKVTFVASNYGVSNGFRASYTTNEPRYCGGQVQITDVTSVNYLISPEYPDLYPNNTQCEWRISTPQQVNQTLFFQFNEFDLEHHDTCNNDRMIFMLPQVDYLTYYTLCGDTLPAPFAMPSYETGVVFQSDDIGAGKFNATYQVKQCGGLIQNQLSGSLASPNFPSQYGSNEYCIWVIVVEQGHSIGVTWEQFRVEHHNDCRYDYVKLFNGPSPNDPMIGNYCSPAENPEGYTPPELHTASNYLTVLFQSDFSVAADGWKMNWAADNSGCGNIVYHQSEGEIKSPGRPGPYTSNLNCKWTIYTEESAHVKLTFSVFSLEGGTCFYDYVEVYDGDSENAPSIGKWCGTTSPGVVESSKSTMLVRFRTDSSVNMDGFEATWESPCGQTISATGNEEDDFGLIVSPNYPAMYNPNTDCSWTLQGQDVADFVRIHFVEFDLEGSLPRCSFDRVKIYAGAAETDLVGTYCGTDLPPSASTHGMMRFVFQTDSSIQRTGFKAEYEFESCGGLRVGETGIINGHTPSDDWSEHRNQNCTWQIRVPDADKVVETKFSMFDLEYHPSCDNDYVALYDGPDVYSPLIGKYCGSYPPLYVKSTSQHLTVEYITDFYETKDGFVMEWKQTVGPPTCGGTVTDTDGVITSPGWNGTALYENNLNCVWNMNGAENKIWQINITDFLLENHASGGGCYDYLEVVDGQLTSDHVIYRQCGNQTDIPVIITSGPYARIRFRTDPSLAATGFSLNFVQVDSECGATLTATTDQQTLTYSNVAFEGNTQIYRCSWFISTTNANKYVDLVTSQFSVAGTSATNCREGYLEYRDYGYSADQAQVHRYCSSDTNQPPPEFKSLGDTVQLLLRNAKNQNSSFTIQYKETDCNRDYPLDSARLYSPGWPQHYPQYQDCSYTITVAQGNLIQMYFNEFDLEHDPVSCDMDYLEVYKGTVVNSANKLGQFCGDTLPAPLFPDNTNQMLLKFKSDQLVSGKGFDLSYTSDPSQCGGNLTGTHGNVYMSFYPETYQAGLDCRWVITVPTTRQIRIHFDEINIRWNQEANICSGDAVYAYNGIYGQPGATWVAGYCGRGSRADIQGSGNVMTFRFLSAANTSDDDRAGFNGFIIRWES